ncbi:alpha/beta-hydrolase [Macroventuria anomochaeta]|uniref:Alpha/beta-hydrolase n=1 Tax=Macroventuria anomochaeta TaxID=301207 RepID=A0ACB6SEA7_9PLEO|nr:alpha/beta-hydrolase [Macroventuria anomochaeta]KAF2632374.1 alpha/beta-hydrolase [Macroventuria anomochaeta]
MADNGGQHAISTDNFESEISRLTHAAYLDPLNQAFANETTAQPPLENLTIEQFRATVEQIQQHEPLPAGGPNGKLPVVFLFHGGAWTARSVNTHDSLCQDITRQTGFAVVFPEYTLAPEARYPTQQEQCYAVVKWIREHGNMQGLSQDLFAIAGDTAGGQLTIAVSIIASTRKPTIPITYQVFTKPVTDTVTTDRDTPSSYQFFNGPFVTIPDADDRTSELATPRNIFPRNAAKQPPTLILCAATDILKDDDILFGEVLQKAGVDVCILTGHGQLHDSVLFEATRYGATPRAMVRLVAAQLKDALASTKEENVETREKRWWEGAEKFRLAPFDCSIRMRTHPPSFTNIETPPPQPNNRQRLLKAACGNQHVLACDAIILKGLWLHMLLKLSPQCPADSPRCCAASKP